MPAMVSKRNETVHNDSFTLRLPLHQLFFADSFYPLIFVASIVELGGFVKAGSKRSVTGRRVRGVIAQFINSIFLAYVLLA